MFKNNMACRDGWFTVSKQYSFAAVAKLQKFETRKFDENFDIFDHSSESTKSFAISSRQSRVNISNIILPNAQLLENSVAKVSWLLKLKSWVQNLKIRKFFERLRFLTSETLKIDWGPALRAMFK